MATFEDALNQMQQVAITAFEQSEWTSLGAKLYVPGETRGLDPENINALYNIEASPSSPAGSTGRADSGGEPVLHKETGFVQIEVRTPLGDAEQYYAVRSLVRGLRDRYRNERSEIRYRSVSVIERPTGPTYTRIDMQFEYEFHEKSN